MRDIAKQMGLSHVTVSMALRGDVRVSAKTRDKVRRYAEAVGYRPDPMLGALAHYRLSKRGVGIKAGVAWINAWPVPERLRAYREFDGYWRGAKAEAEKCGYWLEEFRIGPECPPMRLHQILQVRGIRGILLPPHQDPPEWKEFPWDDYAVVRFGCSLQSPVSHLVGSNQAGNAMLAFSSIRKRGYRRVGFATGKFELVPHGHLFGAGWLAAQAMVAEEDRVPSFMFMNHPVNQRLTSFREWLEDHRPDAIFTDVPEILEMLGETGLKVPQDLGLAVTSVLDLKVDSGINQHAEEIGRAGFWMLSSQINEGNRGESKASRQLFVPGDWVDGASLPWRNASTAY